MPLDRERSNLQQLVQKSGVTLLELSLKLGKNPTYLQQYLKRGSPRVLPEDVRHSLSKFFNCDEAELNPFRLAGMSDPGGEAYVAEPRSSPSLSGADRAAAQTVELPLVSATGRDASSLAFDRGYLASLTDSPLASLQLCRIVDDSMQPTVSAGNLVLLDATIQPQLRDGVFAFVTSGGDLVLRRSQRDFVNERLRLCCDNPLFAQNIDYAPPSISSAGMVVWVAGKIG